MLERCFGSYLCISNNNKDNIHLVCVQVECTLRNGYQPLYIANEYKIRKEW